MQLSVNAGNISMQVLTSYWIKDRKLTEFFFALLCGASKVKMKIFILVQVSESTSMEGLRNLCCVWFIVD